MAFRTATAVAGLRAAARLHSTPRSARRGLFIVNGNTARPTTAAFTRPMLMPLIVLQRGLAVIPGDEGDHSLGTEASPVPHDPYDPFDPESPDDPETCFAYDEKDLESEESMWAMYDRWCVFHDVKRDHEDMLRRFCRFKDRAHSILEFNKSGKPWTQGLNKFGDWTPEEVARFYPRRVWRPPRQAADQCSACKLTK